MTYQEMESEIMSFPRFGTGPDLGSLNQYLELMDHPEESLRVIHVAGTNGKGSVCAFCESILRQAGYRTALFTSPHLIRMNERFRIDFQPVSDEVLTEYWTKVRSVLEEGRRFCYKPVTWFEIMFLISVLLFRDADVDYCIMETGMGGRFDATALLHPMISIITSISLDHTSVLGQTIEEIAFEKAGIIKSGVPAVALDENNGAFEVLLAESRRKNTHIERLSSEDVTILKKRKNKIDFSINTSYYRYVKLTVSGAADYQVYNASLAVIAMKMILPDLEQKAVSDGLLYMKWEGRMEEIYPGVFLDGAHNPGAIAMLTASLKDERKQRLLLFAVCSDKDYSDMIRMLADISWRRIYITCLSGERAADLSDISACFRRYTDTDIVRIADAGEAFIQALHDKKEEEALLCIGSLYLVGEIRRLCESQMELDMMKSPGRPGVKSGK